MRDTLDFVLVQPKMGNDDCPIYHRYCLQGCLLERASNVTSDMFDQLHDFYVELDMVFYDFPIYKNNGTIQIQYEMNESALHWCVIGTYISYNIHSQIAQIPNHILVSQIDLCVCE